MKKHFIRIGIFIGLFLLAELVLALFGNRPGTIEGSLYPVKNLVSSPLFQADSNGITSFLNNSTILPEGYTINKQGFRSEINFDKEEIDSLRKKQNKNVVFLVGDSYTEGCCAYPISDSFASLLYSDAENILLNFGVGGTDLVQYKLIVENYLPLVQPDLVVIAFYLGNDIAYRERPVTPNIAFHYLLKDYPWLNSEKPYFLTEKGEKKYFETPEEAYSFYLNNFTLWGENTAFLEKLIRNSIIGSKIYLGIKEYSQKRKWHSNNTVPLQNDVEIPHCLLLEIKAACDANNTKLLIATIPSPIDVDNQIDLKEKYGKYFENLPVVYPDISLFKTSDYDGMETDNHFNNIGHQKYYTFIQEQINKRLGD
jgi:hypothetical protein